ncbi:MAG TPA: type II toxin-antitoxin system prevent-host-death family antitoxin [Thermoflexales bacterium]|nr:type II toxin-antitoxin system prevent-host-death family antitoxin [Thermoflexales bacterium]HQW34299.1 type II toxin-antitoxin system prevent-host-death family antitoxin [Thermoflexales bacterium]HQZ21787.1 type II toxin-antitoxin system prevent-host-death family antitoxin [Thermoflexales bacterium]HQZ99206.1 type II toxin-antitoxin system prevent-host-death family antitoxin [Thermoflexales bacterium]
MTMVGMRELKENTRTVVDLARNGQEVNITHRGQVVARLVPVRKPISPRKKLSAAWLTMDELAARIGANADTTSAHEPLRREL